MNRIEQLKAQSQHRLSETSQLLFECLMDEMKEISDIELDIQFEDKKDSVRIMLTPFHQGKIPFYVDIFNGYCDFFIDKSIEVFIQHKFKSIQAAQEYFSKFLSSPIIYTQYKTTKETLVKSEYRLSNSKENELLSREVKLMKVKRGFKKQEKVFEPWIKNKNYRQQDV